MNRARRRGGRAPLAFVAAALVAGGAPAAAPPLALRIDATRSRVTFTVARPGETVEGRAPAIAGEIVFDPSDPGRSSVRLEVESAALETGNRIRDRRMRGPHLETDLHPRIVFRSAAIRPAGPAPSGGASGARDVLVEGTLALHGVERPIRFEAAIRYDGRSFAAEGETRIRMSDHGIAIPRFLWMVLDDEVRIRFAIVAAPAGGTTGTEP